VVVEHVASASKYRLQSSTDNGRTWTDVGEFQGGQYDLYRLADDSKVHVRAIAINTDHESVPGPEYPVYVTAKVPLPPDGLKLEMTNGNTSLSWGQVLGVAKYRLYSRRQGSSTFQLLYEGPDTHYRNADIARTDYRVTAINGNGESAASNIIGTDPASCLNWDPQPGEPFRRDNVPSPSRNMPDYYPSPVWHPALF
jgi:hypothetical protein